MSDIEIDSLFIKANINIMAGTWKKTWKQPKCSSTEEWVKKMWCIYTMEYYSAIKKNEIVPFAAALMDLETVILTEVIFRQRSRNTI